VLLFFRLVHFCSIQFSTMQSRTRKSERIDKCIASLKMSGNGLVGCLSVYCYIIIRFALFFLGLGLGWTRTWNRKLPQTLNCALSNREMDFHWSLFLCLGQKPINLSALVGLLPQSILSISAAIQHTYLLGSFCYFLNWTDYTGSHLHYWTNREWKCLFLFLLSILVLSLLNIFSLISSKSKYFKCVIQIGWNQGFWFGFDFSIICVLWKQGHFKMGWCW
jgi:hypothetical protein